MGYLKAAVAGAIAALGQVGVGLVDNMDVKKMVGLAIGAFVVSFGAVYATPNKP